MSYTVSLTNFEGPLELLLRLIEREQMDITVITISKVTSDYLDHMSQLNLKPSDLNWFIGLATKLVNIKSSALLPDEDSDQEDSNDDASRLTQQLKEYRTIRNAADQLGILSKTPATPRPFIESLVNQTLPFGNLTISNLSQAYLSRLDTESEMNLRTPRYIVSKTNINQIIKRLESKLNLATNIELASLLSEADGSHEAVLYFLAVLELHKANKIIIKRSDQDLEERFTLELVNG